MPDGRITREQYKELVDKYNSLLNQHTLLLKDIGVKLQNLNQEITSIKEQNSNIKKTIFSLIEEDLLKEFILKYLLEEEFPKMRVSSTESYSSLHDCDTIYTNISYNDETVIPSVEYDYPPQKYSY